MSSAPDGVDWIKYRIWCVTDARWEYWYLTADDPEPTTCPTNTAHDVNLSSVDEVDRRATNDVTIVEETTRTGGYFQTTTMHLDAVANTTTTADMSWPFPVSAYVVSFTSTSVHEGDCVNMYVAPDTVIGAIAAPVAIDDTVLTVTSTVTQNAKIGFLISITDGVNVDQLGRVLGVDKNLSQITVETAATHAFSPASPTYVRMSVQYVRDYEIGPAAHQVIGDSKIGATYIPANTIVRVAYENKSPATAKTIIGRVDITY